MHIDVSRQIADLATRTTSDADAVGEPADVPVMWGAALGQAMPATAVLEEG